MAFRALFWVGLRAILVILPIIGAIIHPDAYLAPELGLLVSAPIVFALAIFVWLQFTFRRGTMQLQQPFSLTLPFFPISTFPLQFWLLCAVVFIGAGLSKLCVAYQRYHSLTGWSVLLFIGVGILLAVLGWMQWNNRNGTTKNPNVAR